MNFRLTISLAAVLIIVLTLVIFLQTRPTKVEKPKDETALIRPVPSEVTTIALLRAGEAKPALAFARVGTKAAEKWELTAPLKAPAETWRITSIASALKGLKYTDKFKPEAAGVKSLEYIGLDKPRYQITYADELGKEHVIKVGKRSPSGSRYVLVDADPTVYVSDLGERSMLDDLLKPAEDFRLKRLTAVDNKDAVSSIVIARPGQKIKLDRVKDTWVISEPVPARGDSKAVDAMLQQITSGALTNYTDLARVPETGLAPAAVAVKVYGTMETPTTSTSAPATQPAKLLAGFDFGNFVDPLRKEYYYGAQEGSNEVFRVRKDIFDAFNKSLNELVDHALLPPSVKPAEATEVSIKSDKGSLMLKKEGGDWRMSDANLPADGVEVGTLLSSIGNLRANKVVTGAGDLKALGLQPPTVTITLRLPGSSQAETLLVGNAEKDAVGGSLTPVLRQGEQTVMMVQAGDLARLVAPDRLALRSKTVEDISAADVQAIAIVAGGKTTTLEREGVKWMLATGGKKVEADLGKATTLLVEFNPLTTTKWLRTAPDAKFEKGNGDVVVTLTLNQTRATSTSAPAMGPVMKSTTTRTLRLYKLPAAASAPATAPATRWSAVLEGAPWVFEPAQGLVEHLTGTDYAAATTTSAPAK